MSQHRTTLEAVARNHAFPSCSDRYLSAARDAGLIKFVRWPAGHWSITSKGHDYISNEIDGDAEDADRP
jgi:hypothetical protein